MATTQFQKNQRYDVTIEDITEDGFGVAKIDGFTVFVPNTAVGDAAEIQLVKVLKHYAFGRLCELHQASPDRIEPDCEVFARCGGCCYRHISYEAELTIKQKRVQDAFTRLGKIDAPCRPIVGSERVCGYRNKAQFPLGRDQNGKAVAGFYAKHSHRIIPCQNCSLQSDGFAKILKIILTWIDAYQISVYDERTHRGLLRHLFLRAAEKTGEWMVCLVATRRKIPHIEALLEGLKAQAPEVVSVVLNLNTKPTNVILGKECILLAGKEKITDILCGLKLDIAPLSFYQVNRDQAERLYQKAIDLADCKPNELLLDLYCGIGAIGLAAASRVKQIIGVEIVPEAIENAKQNAAQNGIENASFLCGDCKDAIVELEQQGLKPDIIVVDPPRKGCDAQVLDTIRILAPEKVVMVSCYPATAARDCAILQSYGYRVEEYTPFDLFPRTGHVETVVRLTRE